ncbi:DUF433 domain-containing protein [Hymenobacter sp. PAMC 26628]|uniref:DUF433 domain-containing protein n=1 Tax=Hymenobacter sp. PAMC 26628 TaxID=1484118 RepID=UPI00090304DC|nr:DUF433 domain-containing protein [Hymenobacter sp. PAMC 26628]
MQSPPDFSRLTFDLTRNGQPTVGGGRYAVWEVLELLASGRTEAEWQADYPELTAEDVRACLLLAAERCRPRQPVTTSMNGKTAEECEAERVAGPFTPKEFLTYLIKTGKVPPDTKLKNE